MSKGYSGLSKSGGGRGGASGTGANVGYTRDGTIKTNGEKMLVERVTMRGIPFRDPYSREVVLEASTDGNGNLTLSYATPVGYREQNSRTSYAQYEISAGITSLGPTGKNIEMKSNNINWDKVKSVSGKTYGTQSFMREHGFDWDREKKIWKKK